MGTKPWVRMLPSNMRDEVTIFARRHKTVAKDQERGTGKQRSQAKQIFTLMRRLFDEADVVVVPMRHPLKALASNLDRGMNALTLKDHSAAFERVMEWHDDPKVFYLPIDAPDRQTWADNLSQRLGGAKVTDWGPRNETPEKSVDPDSLRIYTAGMHWALNTWFGYR